MGLMGLNSGPVFGPTFSPFLECTSLLFFCTKQAQNFQNHNFLSASQGSLNMLHTWRQRQQQHFVDHELFRTL